MKNKQQLIKQNKLLEIQLLNSRIYKKFNYNFEKKHLKNNNIKNFLKKFSHIIYEYHINNKRMLFLNLPNWIIEKIRNVTKNTKHIFLNKNNYKNGFLTNKKLNAFEELKKNIDLVILFNENTNSRIYKESFNSQIPVIEINNYYKKSTNLSYKLIGHFNFIEKQINYNLFINLIVSILKKSILKKKTITVRCTKKLLKKKYIPRRHYNKYQKKKNYKKINLKLNK